VSGLTEIVALGGRLHAGLMNVTRHPCDVLRSARINMMMAAQPPCQDGMARSHRAA
jgi:hypothetical protein